MNAIDKMAGATVAQIIAVNAGDHHILELELGNGFGQVVGFVHIEWVRPPLANVLLTLIQKMGVETAKFQDAKGTLTGLV